MKKDRENVGGLPENLDGTSVPRDRSLCVPELEREFQESTCGKSEASDPRSMPEPKTLGPHHKEMQLPPTKPSKF